MQFAFEFFLIGELLPGPDEAVLGLEVGGVRPVRLGFGRRRSGSARGAAGLQARREAFQVALLIRREIAAHCDPPLSSRRGFAYSAGCTAADNAARSAARAGL